MKTINKKITITLKEEQLRILHYAVSNFEIETFLRNNPDIEEEGSTALYKDILIDLDEQIKYGFIYVQ